MRVVIGRDTAYVQIIIIRCQKGWKSSIIVPIYILLIRTAKSYANVLFFFFLLVGIYYSNDDEKLSKTKPRSIIIFRRTTLVCCDVLFRVSCVRDIVGNYFKNNQMKRRRLWIRLFCIQEKTEWGRLYLIK
jgi:hypothetical protein